MTRRTLLKGSLLMAGLLLGRLPRATAALAATLPPAELSLVNIHTSERMAVTYRDRSGHYDPGALRDLDRLLRCHYTGEVAHIDVRVIEFLNLVDKTVGGDHEIRIISGYRSPAYNDLLVRQGHGVARHSLHLAGQALDVDIVGVPLARVRQTALALAAGGVGYYPRSGFVHLDSGRVRSW